MRMALGATSGHILKDVALRGLARLPSDLILGLASGAGASGRCCIARSLLPGPVISCTACASTILDFPSHILLYRHRRSARQPDSRNESGQGRSHGCLALRVAACLRASQEISVCFCQCFTRGKPHDHSGRQALSRFLSPGNIGYSTFASPVQYSYKRDARTSLVRSIPVLLASMNLVLLQETRLD